MTSIQSPIISQFIGKGLVITVMAAELLEDTEIAAMEKSVLRLVEEAVATNFVLNFENVKFLSSAVLRVLVKVNAAVVNQRQGKLRLCCIDPKIIEVFKITRLDKVFDIRKNVDEAVESLK
jgi:anti-sigma B factor antagonist